MNIEKIAVIGLGYVGLPLALAFAGKFKNVVGFDSDKAKITKLLQGVNPNGEIDGSHLKSSGLRVTSDERDLADASVYIIAVPTPVDNAHVPDLSYLVRASELVGRVLSRGAVVCYESTVYPGVTDEICAPVVEKTSGLRRGADFTIGYSPERINPGDSVNRLETVVKIVSGEDAKTREFLADLYGSIVEAGIHAAPSIKVAEAAKVIENVQRDLNISLMNELAIIFDRMSINTADVLEAAGTKWNFLRFSPGLVGGHCIGVDPYYLTYKSEEMGYIPQVILAGRRLNDGMGRYIAYKTIKLLNKSGVEKIRAARIGVLGLTFKENVADLRNSKVVDIIRELEEYGVFVLVHDPLADGGEAVQKYGVTLSSWSDMKDLDAIVLAVAHDYYKREGLGSILARLKKPSGVLIDVKSLFHKQIKKQDVQFYWNL
ncbi:MAG: nucleotide sugar dehydrogenase [Synergistaceae bacterium]|jgi:UDP-N-acetyl-D-galactosamine dehydrogenase|nr:nucleotide sugar dehydrogenase [Synergistaceae bacterium]